MLLVRNGSPTATIVIGSDATWIERHAAGELQKYLLAISGARLPIVVGGVREGNIVAIGRAETNPVVAALVDRGLALSTDSPGLDGFVIETTKLDERDVLVLGGSMDRGTLYAVYALLEEHLGVGFFRDGEWIPSMPTIDLPALAISDRPRFAVRTEQNGCMFHYSATGWTWDDWVRELDWKAKRRVTAVYPFMYIGPEIVPEILAEWGVTIDVPAQTYLSELHKRLTIEARKRGIAVPYTVPSGHLPAAFFEKFPGARTIVTQWSELPPTKQLHPEDPLYHRLVVESIRRFGERYGNDHLYIAEFTSESKILEGVTDVRATRVAFARSVSKALAEADPDGVWVPSSWSFDMDARDDDMKWTPDDIRAYLDAMTVPNWVWGIWDEEAAKYKRNDGYFGHQWTFGVLHAFGGTTWLHGNARGLVDQAHEIVNGPLATGCIGFGSQEEIVDFNGFYLELAQALSWDPLRITPDGWIATWCARRYGDSGAAIEPAWELLANSVYGPESGGVALPMDPLYWLRPCLELAQGWPDERAGNAAHWPKRAHYIPKLRRAIDVFLDNPALLAESELARRDLVDVTRQWIAERFNQTLIRARDGFLAGDRATLDHEGEAALRLLDDQARLLASWPQYRMDRKVETYRPIHGDRAEQFLKHTHVWCFSDGVTTAEPLRDYYRMDLDTLVADYYKPRIAAFLDVLRHKLARGEKTATDDELALAYQPIEDAFLAAPLRSLPADESPVDVVRDLMASADGGC